ncbi:helix-turn-helix domain-containing protein [Dactylosporangium sp. NPDC049525]|uniref:helix-turn-helix domain-containing protein n=1 Tax=Dactylosporangium sp. NPDC049525 TaxID=3154730 RepID=UPI003449592F
MLGGYHGATYYLASSVPGERVELPPTLYRVLHQVVDALRQGLAVTVVPHSQTLTTQQAADLLGVGRPTVIKLLDSGRYAALEATAVDLDDESDLESTLSELREARRAVAARRRAGTT